MCNIPKVIKFVVKNDLCIGCGLCVYQCPKKALEMKWNEFGFLAPELTGSCTNDGACISVCPFNPYPAENIKTENELADIFLKDTTEFHPQIGKYQGIYAGYAEEFRLTSSSGGIATFIMTDLLERGIVDHIFSVKESQTPGVYYEYAVSNNKQELLSASKTRYYPVTLSTVFTQIDELEGKVAIVGVACFIKAIRLAQHMDTLLKVKIPFLIGIICGGIKSRFFTEYLSDKAGVPKELCVKPEYRIKDLNSTASDYSFGCINKKDKKVIQIKMRTVGDMWGTGLFKANACDFCDDVTTELADISLGDAWLSPFNNEGCGTNILVTRSIIAEYLIKEGIKNGKLQIEQLPLERFLSSQKGSFNHRQIGLSSRLNLIRKLNIQPPPKRFGNEKVLLDFKIVQKIRIKVRQKSLETWKNSPDEKAFNRMMSKQLNLLFKVTQIYHYRKAIMKRIIKFISQ